MDYKLQMKRRFREVRLSLKMSQAEFAEALKMKQGNVSQIELEATQRGVPEKAILLLEKLYNINPVWLQTGKGDMMKQLSKTEPNQYPNDKSDMRVDLKDRMIEHLLSQVEELKEELAQYKTKEQGKDKSKQAS